MRMMITAPKLQRAPIPEKYVGTVCTSLGDATPQEKTRLDERQGAAGPSVCAFWSVVAIGALVTGWPTESVSCASYVCALCLRERMRTHAYVPVSMIIRLLYSREVSFCKCYKCYVTPPITYKVGNQGRERPYEGGQALQSRIKDVIRQNV